MTQIQPIPEIEDSIVAGRTLVERPWRRGFWSLFATQFQGAFSDNIFKFLVTFLIIGTLTPAERDRLVPLVGALFALPFLFFSMAGGFLADRFSKRTVAVGTKIAEIGIMTLGMIGLWLSNVALLLAVIFLMSAQSAFFGPTKYGLLPELLPEKRLSWGNGILGLGTFVAIIVGTVIAGMLSELLSGRQVWSGVVLIILACVGLSASLGIDRLPPANPQKQFQVNFLGDLMAQLRQIRRDRVLFLAILASTYFWFLGALLQPNILIYGKDILGLNDLQSGFLQAALAIGIGIGSFTAGYVSGKKIEYGLVPLGAMGLTGFALVLAQADLTFAMVASYLALLGFFGGFYIVPLNALIQHRPDRGRKGSVIATSAFLAFVGVFLSAGAYYLLVGVAQLKPPQVFLAGAILTFCGTAYVLYLLPDALLRLMLWFFTHSIYRIRVEGRDNIPEKGGGLLVCNHMSLVDALLLIASTDRPIRFLMYKGIYDRPWIKPFARILRSIPISSELRPRDLIHALKTASEAIRAGEIVCIFAEGQITRIGQLLPFRRGFERIMKDVDAPIIPVSLEGVWGSIFSFEKGRFIWKWPRRIPYPVTVSYGAPMPPDATPFAVRQAVQELNADAWKYRKDQMETLHRRFVRSARKHPFRMAMADARSGPVRFGAALARTIFLAQRLRSICGGQEMIGVLLPPSVPGALVNFALMLIGKVPVHLNYTLSQEALASCVQQCQISTVVTSKTFLEKIKLTPPCSTVLLEEAAKAPGVIERMSALLLAVISPARWLERCLRAERRMQLDDLATVIFSSGSTGEPKGVMLTHYNVGANVEQLGQTFALTGDDRILGVLPFFHSFGFTGTLSLPAAFGIGVVFHSNPLEARVIGGLVEEYKVTMLLATPTFLQMYMRGCSPEQFGSVQFTLVGAEKLRENVARAFEDQFGIRPLEAYGCTECAPAVTVNTRDFRAPGFRQIGAKRGKIGHPLPGVAVRIIDLNTREPLPPGRSGLLLVRGPNVMSGYLGRPEKTAEVLQNGWYVTGDVAMLDEDGFLEITDRLSRFSKIGGEMVPHVKVEEKLHELAGLTEQTFAVTGVPDEKKGERLAVIHKLALDKLQGVLEKLAQADLPNLWKPRPDQFIQVSELPYLGTGKLDLRRVREIAAGGAVG